MTRACDTRPLALEGEPEERLAVLRELALEGTEDPAVWDLFFEIVAENPRAEGARFAAAILRKVQSFRYVVDRGGRDDGRNLCAVILERRGDCKKLACLLAALYALAGFRAVLCWIDQPWTDDDHVSLRVDVGGGLERWAEPTIRGARLGENPYAAADRLNARRNGGL